jgi:hypothetical protein
MAKAKQSRAEILAGIERRRIETAAARREAMRLESTGAEARVCEEKGDDGKTRIFVRARRIDVFQLLLERGALPQESFDAVRAYETDLATAQGFNTPERRPDYIRGSVEGAPGQNVTQRMIEASRMVQWVEAMLTTRDAQLLKALLHENDANCGRWRGTVERITGETRDESHAVAIRCMAANLRDVRDRYQPERRMAA